MRKLFGIIAMAAIAAVAGWNFSQSQNEVELSDLALANVEALARIEGQNDAFETVDFAHDHLVDEIKEGKNNFPDLLGCFSNEGFDQKRFIDFAEDFFNEFPETMDKKRI